MTTFGNILAAIGFAAVLIGILAEGLGIVAMTSAGLRQKLPVSSPFVLTTCGGAAFVLGMVCLIVGRWLAG